MSCAIKGMKTIYKLKCPIDIYEIIDILN